MCTVTHRIFILYIYKNSLYLCKRRSMYLRNEKKQDYLYSIFVDKVLVIV